ncbi:bile acid:sodium symporter family protein [Trueperella bialowiezensis]|uniref:Bile acid transporter n=1 Tax=Trueperella bialowiezensis TaxID=312285 RepID=A0A3S4UYD5_9ACTO|nr:bile acid:sodium symporter family protein [Trueperella bialowiezensis]VEI12906.1 bile acid transporter [Trueperella bialowiezensis]
MAYSVAEVIELERNGVGVKKERAARLSAEDRSALVAVTVFPAIIVIGAVWAYHFPTTAAHLTPYVSPGLGFIMFTMGLTLTLEDFRRVAERPLAVALGVAAQYVIMPLAAIGLVHLLNLPAGIAIGVILVGTAPGGTASNVVAYLAKADVALSVTLTTVSTLLAPVFTPLLVQWLAGTLTEIDGGAMAISILKTVVIPVVGGVLLRLLIPRVIDRLLPVLPWISTVGITLVVAALVPGSVDALRTAVGVVFAAVILHNLAGLAFGYGVSKLTGQEARTCRTVSIEVGMQNSGLAATLAKTHFPATPEAALPGVIFSVWHNISGALIALIYRRRAEAQARTQAAPDHAS